MRMPYRTGGINCHGHADTMPGEMSQNAKYMQAAETAERHDGQAEHPAREHIDDLEQYPAS